mmetsp:Transcript_107695/g.246628  ORF Transcript_107695/g.246628 Transcript_107695/m.246628 type:complete len:285 (-) Transcript_107695:6-860(-)
MAFSLKDSLNLNAKRGGGSLSQGKQCENITSNEDSASRRLSLSITRSTPETVEKRNELLRKYIRQGRVHKLEKAVLCGCDPTTKDRYGRDALSFAAMIGSISCVEFLLASKERHDVSSADRDGLTPLHWACRSKAAQPDIAIALIEAGFDVNVQSHDEDFTPLMYAVRAAEAADLHVVRHLLASRADLSLQNKEGHTAAGMVRAQQVNGTQQHSRKRLAVLARLFGEAEAGQPLLSPRCSAKELAANVPRNKKRDANATHRWAKGWLEALKAVKPERHTDNATA